MSDRHDHETRLAPEEEAFVRRIADAYAPPRRTASERMAFQARLEQRLDGRAPRAHLAWGLAFGAAVVGAAFLLYADHAPSSMQTASPTVAIETATPSADDAAVQREAILALVIDPESGSDAALPAEYEAIASVFLGG